ncbi:thiol-disulfide oxidoreductase DCC family protein [Shewanella algidipiscicola]|uniref:Thiol-disulfide oxidoreductase n=1 Tax=Shewanella algidipiscicola TaxID=614070 RepID=A0ABQ4PH72_9GAMM|nr:DCC1-like thiol-disulfide oxidoreductase family protein [Shewanella algidipiscicola]GIU46893.1 thiol-disulfide oxidoreductase [Shewanella algidipiscicola]
MIQQPVVIFDGRCNLCHGAVRFIVKRDPKGVFKFASIQSPKAQQLLRQRGVECDIDDPDSVYLIKGAEVMSQSDAALDIAGALSGGWPLLRLFKIVPRPLRDWCYRQVARRRYRLFGQRQCALPSEIDRRRFLDSDTEH